MQTALILNDLQLPFVDQPVVDLISNFAKELGPKVLVLNGDIVDMYAISDFDRDPLTEARLEDEIRLARVLMEDFDWIDTKIWIGGNHEDRLRRYIWKHASAFAGLPGLQFYSLFGLGDYGFYYQEYGEYTMLGKLLVTHGDLVRSASGATARAHFDKYGCSVITGHTHRLGIYYRTRRNKPYASYENGCLCSLKPEYVKYPDWQQGFAVVHYEEHGPYSVQQIPILRSADKPYFYYGKDKIV